LPLVPGGGVSPDSTRWVACRASFFLPVRVLSRLFRRLFLENLKAAFEPGGRPSSARAPGLPPHRPSPAA
jgi:hypothetical protein